MAKKANKRKASPARRRGEHRKRRPPRDPFFTTIQRAGRVDRLEAERGLLTPDEAANDATFTRGVGWTGGGIRQDTEDRSDARFSEPVRERQQRMDALKNGPPPYTEEGIEAAKTRETQIAATEAEIERRVEERMADVTISANDIRILAGKQMQEDYDRRLVGEFRVRLRMSVDLKAATMTISRTSIEALNRFFNDVGEKESEPIS